MRKVIMVTLMIAVALLAILPMTTFIVDMFAMFTGMQQPFGELTFGRFALTSLWVVVMGCILCFLDANK